MSAPWMSSPVPSRIQSRSRRARSARRKGTCGRLIAIRIPNEPKTIRLLSIALYPHLKGCRPGFCLARVLPFFDHPPDLLDEGVNDVRTGVVKPPAVLPEALHLIRQDVEILIDDPLSQGADERPGKGSPEPESIGQVGVHRRPFLRNRDALRGDGELAVPAEAVLRGGDVGHVEIVDMPDRPASGIQEAAEPSDVRRFVFVDDGNGALGELHVDPEGLVPARPEDSRVNVGGVGDIDEILHAVGDIVLEDVDPPFRAPARFPVMGAPKGFREDRRVRERDKDQAVDLSRGKSGSAAAGALRGTGSLGWDLDHLAAVAVEPAVIGAAELPLLYPPAG